MPGSRIIILLLGAMLAAPLAYAQTWVGVQGGVQDIRFFPPPKPTTPRNPRAEFQLHHTATIGLTGMISRKPEHFTRIDLTHDRLELSYQVVDYVQRFYPIRNNSTHGIQRFRLGVTHLLPLARMGRVTLLLGPGAKLSLMDVRSSEGSGLYSNGKKEVTDSAGVVHWVSDLVFWEHDGRNPSSIFRFNFTGLLELGVHCTLSNRLALLLTTQAELLLTPWVRDGGVPFRSNRTFGLGLGMHYALKASKEEQP